MHLCRGGEFLGGEFLYGQHKEELDGVSPMDNRPSTDMCHVTQEGGEHCLKISGP